MGSNLYLHTAINLNIRSFWCRLGSEDKGKSLEELWSDFREWCFQDCKEIFPSIRKQIIIDKIDLRYSKWVDVGTKLGVLHD